MSKMSLSLFLGLLLALYCSFFPIQSEIYGLATIGIGGSERVEYAGIPFATSATTHYHIEIDNHVLYLQTQQFFPLALMFDWLIFAGLIRLLIFGHDKINTKEKQYRLFARLSILGAILTVLLVLLLPISLFLRGAIGLWVLTFVMMSFSFEQDANRLKDRREIAEMRRKK